MTKRKCRLVTSGASAVRLCLYKTRSLSLSLFLLAFDSEIESIQHVRTANRFAVASATQLLAHLPHSAIAFSVAPAPATGTASTASTAEQQPTSRYGALKRVPPSDFVPRMRFVDEQVMKRMPYQNLTAIKTKSNSHTVHDHCHHCGAHLSEHESHGWINCQNVCRICGDEAGSHNGSVSVLLL